MNDITAPVGSAQVAGVSIESVKTSARDARDRRDILELRRLTAMLAERDDERDWVESHTIFCDAVDALRRESKDADTALRLSPGLKRSFDFALSARLLEPAWNAALEATPCDANLVRNLGHELALCTYKDEDRVATQRFDAALRILGEVRKHTGGDGETLRLTGAVYKRRWEIDGDVGDLLTAHDAYLEAWNRDKDEDAGYGAINAAFIADALAAGERERAKRLGTLNAIRQPGRDFANQARALRLAVRELLLKRPMKDYWHIATLAEASFGLGEYECAAEQLREARKAGASGWQIQATARQLATLFAHQAAARDTVPEDVQSQALAALRELADVSADHAFGLARGRVGLALSGGGFRASLYHLGVLARLADMDVLRHVEAISTVSGGSIVGAHYYLKLKKILEPKGDEEPVANGDKEPEAKGDKELGRERYVEIIGDLIEDFVRGVRTNLRMQTLSSLASNVRMMLDSGYTRSARLGDLYDEYFYKPEAEADRTKPLRMAELLVTPAGAPNFNPKFENWRRDDKVPVLLLNATPLNTGHGWQFTARSMGVPPALASNEIDCKPRYRRLHYTQAPTAALRDFGLGHAVAASAGVPGLFEPIVLEGLYPDRTVRLVDGGVHDNQGVGALLNEGCTFILCSDASGQMGEERDPPASTIGVLARTNSVMMDRVRDAQYLDLDARKQSRSLTGLVFLHLKKGIGAEKLDWVNSQDPSKKTLPQPLAYGIDREIQETLANLRTDLDAFTDEEAAALMASGYLMTEQEFTQLDAEESDGGGRWGGFDIRAKRGEWCFLNPSFLALLAAPKNSTPERAALGKRLNVGSGLFFKVLRVDMWSWVITLALLATMGAGVWYFAGTWLKELIDKPFSLRDLALPAALALLVIAVPVLGWLRPDNIVRKWAVRAGFALLGWIVCNGYLLLFNHRYLAAGRLKGFCDAPRTRVRP